MSGQSAVPAPPACTWTAQRWLRWACAFGAAAATTASRSMWTWISPLFQRSTPEATRAWRSRRPRRWASAWTRTPWARRSRTASPNCWRPTMQPGDKPDGKQRARAKTARIPIKVVPQEALKKPAWIRVRAASDNSRFAEIKRTLRAAHLHTVCEEASCPNIGECFGKGTATFMILGDLCTRRCPFCDVAHGRPLAPDAGEPVHLAESGGRLGLGYVGITSVGRDDLKDGGAKHFADCIRAVRERSPRTTIEVLVPDFD